MIPGRVIVVVILILLLVFVYRIVRQRWDELRREWERGRNS